MTAADEDNALAPAFATEPLFVIRRRRQVVYGRCDLTIGDKLAAARKFVSDENK